LWKWLLGGCAALLVAGCQDAGPAPTNPPTTVSSARQWTMPNLVGSVLQQAQDQIQALTGGAILITTSHDATGQERSQVLDANWKVCTQSIAAGSPITERSTIDFGAVMLSENCP
jgi:hypothetical protein